MKCALLIFGAMICCGSLFGAKSYDGITDLLCGIARTNAYSLANNQTSTNIVDMTGRLAQAAVDGGFNDATALTNTLRSLLCTNVSMATTTTTVTSVQTTVTNSSAKTWEPDRSHRSRQRMPFRGPRGRRSPSSGNGW